VDYFTEPEKLSLTVTDENYADNIHDTLPIAIYESLEDREDFRETFNIRSPTRVINEGINTSSWRGTEDWAITGSYNGGELIIGQSVSCSEKEPLYGKPYELIQLRSFENRLRYNPSVYERLNGLYVVSVEEERDNVLDMERDIRNSLENNGNLELEVSVKELEKSERDWEEVFKQLS